MRHNQYNLDFSFVHNPVPFNKFSDKDFLEYCVGAALYMPAIKDFCEIIIKKNIPGLASIVVCFEDALDEKDVPYAEKFALDNLKRIIAATKAKTVSKEDTPLIFFRVRNIEQFKRLSAKTTKEEYEILAGFVFPKFSVGNGEAYFAQLKKLNSEHNTIIYGMPILESEEIAFNETRREELMGIKGILDSYKELVLNVRVGSTDFSSCFAVRRGIDYSIYDILTVKDCLMDILNTFARKSEYVVSGPVWEFFLVKKENKFDEELEFSLQSSLLKRKKLINEAIDGLLREVVLDKANGFVGKTAIHPTHIKYINAMQAVTEEEYNDAKQILDASGGVIKSPTDNKMNEIIPHRSWAMKIYNKAKAYGVIKDEMEYIKLVSSEDFR